MITVPKGAEVTAYVKWRCATGKQKLPRGRGPERTVRRATVADASAIRASDFCTAKRSARDWDDRGAFAPGRRGSLCGRLIHREHPCHAKTRARTAYYSRHSIWIQGMVARDRGPNWLRGAFGGIAGKAALIESHTRLHTRCRMCPKVRTDSEFDDANRLRIDGTTV
jgi:hypothetical protein